MAKLLINRKLIIVSIYLAIIGELGARNINSVNNSIKRHYNQTELVKKHSNEYVIYVSTNGNDSNVGTEKNPLASLEGAKIKVRHIKTNHPSANIIVYLHKGYYQLDKTFTLGLKDGTNGNSTITYASYPGEEAIIGSGIKLSHWKLVKNLPYLPVIARGHVYETDIPDDIQNIFTMYDNGIMVPRARSKGFEIPLPHLESYEPSDKALFNKLVCPPGLLRNWDNPSDIEAIVVPNFPWTLNILQLASVDMNTHTATTILPSTYPLRSVVDYRRINPNAWLENAIDFLGKPGEWVVNTKLKKIWYWPKSGIPDNDIRIPKLSTLIKVAGITNKLKKTDIPVKGIVFKNLCFMNADRVLWNINDKGIQHDWAMEDKGDALIRFRGAEKCKVLNCEFINSGGDGIRLDYYCEHIKIENNEFNNLGQSAIVCIGYGPGKKDVNKYNFIFNNDIHDCGQIYWDSPMIILWQSGNNIVSNNFIHDAPRQAILISGVRYSYFFAKTGLDPRQYWKTIRWNEVKYTGRKYEYYIPFLHAKNNVIENNEIRNVLTMMGDGAAINISGAGLRNIVRHNLIYDIKNTFADAALRTDDYQKGSVFEDNIVFRSKIPGAVVKGENIFKNNYFINLVTAYTVPWGGVFGNVEAYAHQSFGYGKSNWSHNVFYSDIPTYDRKFYASKTVGDEYKYVFWDYNVYYMKGIDLKNQEYNKLLRAAGKDTHSIYENPGFKDPSNWNFSISDNSPIFKEGINPILLQGIGLTSSFPVRFHPDKGFRGEIK
ncbi:right-handed parallel beta-helix repeat-containing protein [Microbacter margulisiae]|uniref:Right handed beta helix domain-containing protein n=1 Tax=Microbacter margulisiae TaxID=1350067 RepID=A0A7W5H1C0_9PORP|nr:right-handed parallel beta-helix repeat-containing protein [Microbacter margulisiae]MBB3186201.1 hypothetical protein [Microbacter margulisiae]